MRFKKPNLRRVFNLSERSIAYNSRNDFRRSGENSEASESREVRENREARERREVRDSGEARKNWETTPNRKSEWNSNSCENRFVSEERQTSENQTTPKTQNESGGGRCSLGNGTQDKGNAPIVIDIVNTALGNDNFRTALWTGSNLQLTVMSVPVGEEIGIEKHDNLDQLIGVISGVGEVTWGKLENNFSEPERINQNNIFMIPKGTYHNVKNIGRTPLNLYSVYAPKAHPFGTVEKRK